MSALATALAYRRLVEESVALRLLRADNAAVIAALLTTHLGAPGARLPVEELHERIDADLEVLRDHVDLPRTARAYCDDWRSAGFLTRRPATAARGETLELSPAAVAALRVFTQLETPRTTVTQSRLVNLAAAVRQLAIETDPDGSRRLAALHEDRARIEEEIERVRGGEVEVLDRRQALERTVDLLMQAQDLPGDFAGVRARFEQLNHDLRARILASEGDDVLAEIFRGVDLIEASDEGRTFTAFSALMRDHERASALESDLAAVLERGFADELDAPGKRALRYLVRDLKRGSREVHGVLTEFARGLRRYVYSQEFQRDRVLRDALQGALVAAIPASRVVKPYAAMSQALELSTLRLSSLGEITAHDPSDFDTGGALPDADEQHVDLAELAALARESEIDFVELIDNVNALIGDHCPLSVAQLLRERPATQGLASVVGLLSLATEHGEVRPDTTERIVWRGQDDVERTARVTVHVFTAAIA